jgi:uncharacterized protein
MVRDNKTFEVPQQRRRAASRLVVLIALSAAANFASAASFRCPHDASASEKLICGDPELSSLDDKLATIYQRAKDAAPAADAIEADRVAQWQWRQRNCKDKACVESWYERRIRELEADFSQGQDAEAAGLAEHMSAQNIAPDARAAVVELKGLGREMDTPLRSGTPPAGQQAANCSLKPGRDSCFASSAHEAVLGLEKTGPVAATSKQ